MPGFELINNEERNEVLSVFNKGGGTLFRHSYENLRKNSFKVVEFLIL